MGAALEMGLVSSSRLAVVTLDSQVVMEPRLVEADGSFAVNLLLPVPVKLQILQGGGSQWFGGRDFASANIYDPQPGQALAGVDLVQSGLRVVVSGDVVQFGSGILSFHDPVDLSLVASVETGIAPGHTYGITSLSPGSYLLRVDPTSGTSRTSIGCPSGTTARRAPISRRRSRSSTPATSYSVDLTLEAGGEIRGLVVNGGDPNRYFHVVATSVDSPAPVDYDFVPSSDLHYLINGLEDGGYRIGAVAGGSGWSWPDPLPEGVVWYPGTTDWFSASTVEIRDAAVVEGIDIPVD